MTDLPARGRISAKLSRQGAERLHDRRIRQGAVANGQAAARQNPNPTRAAAGDQLGDQACLTDAGLAPHKNDSRLAVCGPHLCRFEKRELLDAAHKGWARHAAAHLAGIIPRPARAKRATGGASDQR
jgi:hypothetical protein